MSRAARMKSLYHTLQQRFFDGPAVFNYPGRRMTGYRSVNVLFSQWVHAYVVTKCTVAGGMLVLVACLVTFGGLTTTLMPLYFLAFTLIALLIVDMVVGWLRRPRVELVRQLPDCVSPESSIPVNYQITNRRPITSWNVVLDYVPLHRHLSFPRGRAMIDTLAPGETVQLQQTLTATRRGKYLVPVPIADSAFPFGLWRWGQLGRGNTTLLVHPRYQRLRNFNLIRGVGMTDDRYAATNQAGQSVEFMGCREFRFGDNPRFIHSPSWARLGTPVVKEFCDEAAGQIAVFIDCFPPALPFWRAYRDRGWHPQFEAALSLAAAIMDFAFSHRLELQLLSHARGDEPETTVLRHYEIDELQQGLKALSQGEALTGRFPSPDEQILSAVSRAGAACAIFVGWDDEREALANAIARANSATAFYQVVEQATPGSGQVVTIPAASILAGSITEL